MKTAKIDLNYDFGGKDTVEITNSMAPLHIGRSESGQVEIRAELSIPSFAPGTDLAEYFHVDEDGKTLEIGLERIPELNEAFLGTGRSQVWVKVPSGAAVIAGSPAQAAGLKDGDVILEISGQKLDQKNSLARVIAKYNPGDKVKLKVRRAGGEIELEATLGERGE